MAALQASDWAVPTAFDDSYSGAIDAVANCTVGNPRLIRVGAKAAFDHATRQGEPHPRVVHLSSMTIYGSLDRKVDETTPPLMDLGDYGAAHVEAEALANAYPNSVILRCGCEYGPGCPQWSERIARLLLAHRLGDLGTAGDGICNLLYIDDLIDAIMTSLQSPAATGQTFNLAMRSAPSWNEYLIRFGILLHAVPVSRITARQLKLEAKLLAPPFKLFELAAQRLVPGYSSRLTAITPSLIQLCRQRITLDATKAEALLGMRWTGLDAGLQLAATAYLSRLTPMAN